MTRIKHVEAPKVLPGKCGLCGTAMSDRGFVDTSLSFDFFGALYFCYNCVSEMGYKFGLLNHEKSQALTTELVKTKKELEETKEALNELDRLRGYLSTAKHIVDTPSSASIPTEPDRESPLEIARRAGRGNQKTDEPSNV